MIAIEPIDRVRAEVAVPGSKSYTHRMLIAAALSDGLCTLVNGLKSEDTLLTAQALQRMGVRIDIREDRYIVHGTSGGLDAADGPIFLGNSGTSLRLLTAVSTLGKGRYQLTGSQRMQQRPIHDLIEGLTQLGVSAMSLKNNGCPPVEIQGGRINGGSIRLNCEKSSQFLSAVLLIAPYSRNGIDITVTRGPVSRPYIDMTLAVMEMFGIRTARRAYQWYGVPGGGCYRAGEFTVEPDASQAGYFWAAAAITGGEVKVKGFPRNSRQGDVRLVELLKDMGCRIRYEADGIRVVGGALHPIDADMADIPDMVPTLAVVAAFAPGTTIIRNVAHLALKESNRLAAVSNELQKMGIQTRVNQDGLVINGGRPHGATIATYDDHRIAMSFGIAGLRVPGVVIEAEGCVAKSFPNFWEVFQGLYRQ